MNTASRARPRVCLRCPHCLVPGGAHANVHHTSVWQPVPEPSAVLLLRHLCISIHVRLNQPLKVLRGRPDPPRVVVLPDRVQLLRERDWRPKARPGRSSPPTRPPHVPHRAVDRRDVPVWVRPAFGHAPVYIRGLPRRKSDLGHYGGQKLPPRFLRVPPAWPSRPSSPHCHCRPHGPPLWLCGWAGFRRAVALPRPSCCRRAPWAKHWGRRPGRSGAACCCPPPLLPLRNLGQVHQPVQVRQRHQQIDVARRRKHRGHDAPEVRLVVVGQRAGTTRDRALGVRPEVQHQQPRQRSAGSQTQRCHRSGPRDSMPMSPWNRRPALVPVKRLGERPLGPEEPAGDQRLFVLDVVQDLLPGAGTGLHERDPPRAQRRGVARELAGLHQVVGPRRRDQRDR